MKKIPIGTIQASVIDLPLRGEWSALNTPDERIPSHGTDYFGQRYAYDFVQLSSPSKQPYRTSFWQHLLGLTKATDCYAWDQVVVACFDGEVIEVGDGWADRERLSFVWDVLRAKFFAEDAKTNDYRPLIGNYILLKNDIGVALYAHLRCHSIRVQKGQIVKVGEPLGNVGNSGNSVMPHLHFHLMSCENPFQAEGILCAFREYEILQQGRWEKINNGIPKLLESIRCGV
jgi:hypothetical protein